MIYKQLWYRDEWAYLSWIQTSIWILEMKFINEHKFKSKINRKEEKKQLQISFIMNSKFRILPYQTKYAQQFPIILFQLSVTVFSTVNSNTIIFFYQKILVAQSDQDLINSHIINI